jgi:hypothetical protein
MTTLDAGSTIPTGSTEQWTDKKRYLWLLGLVVPSLAFAAWGLHALTGWGVFWYLGPIVVFGVVPAIDLVAGLDRSNPPDDVIEALENDRYYRWITYLFLPVQYAALVWACWMYTTGDLSVSDKLGLALSIGTIAGIEFLVLWAISADRFRYSIAVCVSPKFEYATARLFKQSPWCAKLPNRVAIFRAGSKYSMPLWLLP